MKFTTNGFIHLYKKRYYHIFLSEDLLGDFTITKAWVAIDNYRRRIAHTYKDIELALKQLVILANYRIKRGYKPEHQL
jgi:hypothetical protein